VRSSLRSALRTVRFPSARWRTTSRGVNCCRRRRRAPSGAARKQREPLTDGGGLHDRGPFSTYQPFLPAARARRARRAATRPTLPLRCWPAWCSAPRTRSEARGPGICRVDVCTARRFISSGCGLMGAWCTQATHWLDESTTGWVMLLLYGCASLCSSARP
jgi:hypothetical protein